MAKDWFKRLVSRRVAVEFGTSKKIEFVEVLPGDRLICGVMFTTVALIGSVVLEIIYVVIFRSFNDEISACITFIIGAILGSFFAQKN